MAQEPDKPDDAQASNTAFGKWDRQKRCFNTKPETYYGWVFIIGVLAGIGYFLVKGDMVLLSTFLGLVGGKALGKSQHL